MGSPRTIRLVSVVEGISLLVLLLIAMPLKYGLGIEEAVKVVGMGHGLLFLGLCLVLFMGLLERAVPFKVLAAVGALSVVPFGFLVADRMVRRTEEAAAPA